MKRSNVAVIGVVADMMVHDPDEPTHLVGRLPDTARAVIRHRAAAREGEGEAKGRVESAGVLLSWRDGPVAHVSATRRAAHGFEQGFEIFGSDGRLACNDPLVSPVVLDGRDDTRVARRHRRFRGRYLAAYEADVERFAATLAGREHSRCTFRDGLRAHDLADMVTSAAEVDGTRHRL